MSVKILQLVGFLCTEKLKKNEPLWSRVLITKHSDNTLHLLDKTVKYENRSKHNSELLSNRRYKSGRIGLHEYMLNSTLFFTHELLTDAFIKFLDTQVKLYPNVELILVHCSFSSICVQHAH